MVEGNWQLGRKKNVRRVKLNEKYYYEKKDLNEKETNNYIVLMELGVGVVAQKVPEFSGIRMQAGTPFRDALSQ